MEGDNNNFPYFFASSNSFPLSTSSNINDSNSNVVMENSMQNSQFSTFDHGQIDLARLLCGAGPLEETTPVSLNIGEVDGDSSCRNKSRFGRKKKNIPARVAFHTRSAEDILDDGYKWRKYGQKSVKNSIHPRSYYRCTHHTCNVKKQIQRQTKDTTIVVTTYEGIHNHPCEKLMETLSPLLKQLQFLSRF
ncbi:hypothetical protein ABFS82_01G068500 [Erythranthe guttata]|nr:PREDICTED: probable WRKY transcription factor 43 [Erythranthe guttata]|eukprot:XP_012854206.1 PREDICTED: probable WRKY transcription factor 43 [Erythranthe guttata]